MKISRLYEYFDEKLPLELREDWDNDGKMLISSDKEVKKVIVALDLTPCVIKKAIDESYDLIVTHHPVIFKPIKGITDPKFTALIKADVSVFSFHTRLDTVKGGVNDTLAALLGLKNIYPFAEMGRVGDIEETEFDVFAETVKGKLACEKINVVKNTDRVKKVALLGGGGKDFWEEAAKEADVYITGEMSHNTMLDAYEAGASIIEAGHFHTEFPVCRTLADMIRDADPEISVDIIEDYPVKTV